MGIYIRGMNMPPEGLQETILLTHNKATVNSNRAWKGYEEFETVSISEHGDLIDRDKLAISTAVSLDGKPYKYVHIDNIKCAPIVIPSDLSKEEQT